MIRTLLVAIALASANAFAGADLGGPDDVHDEGLVFFGFVRDGRGAPVVDAKVSASAKNGVTFIARTGATGSYRFSTFSRQVNPADVVISCAKEGYKQTRVARRPIVKADPPKPVETECRLERS